MDRKHHLIQDTAEVYAVAVMQEEADRLGVAGSATASDRRREFESYLNSSGLTASDFDTGLYQKYKTNVDRQIPAFVARLVGHHDFVGRTLDFRNDEAAMRVLGQKADFLISVSSSSGQSSKEIAVSLKNYTGAGGITRPQVSSGTYLSFACGFVFDRVGVGLYADPREGGRRFRGQDRKDRDAVLRYEKRESLIEPLAVLEALQQRVREELLSDSCRMYEAARVKAVVAHIAPIGIEAVLKVFDLLGQATVRTAILARMGLDGTEESLFFDAKRYVDSMTNPSYRQLLLRLNDPDTVFTAEQHKQGIRFCFSSASTVLLKTDVPFTINTNGAWFRPKERYSGKRPVDDKDTVVHLEWGERRPRKSREIATSTNTYIDPSQGRHIWLKPA